MPVLKHGMSGTGIYKVWDGMMQRCNNPKSKVWNVYGSRGVKVRPRWLKFENFFKDMPPRPPKMTLERANNNLGYSKRNCRWATQSAQLRNTRPKGACGLIEVCLMKDAFRRKPYRAAMHDRGVLIYVEYFNTSKKAAKAYQAARKKFERDGKL